MIEVKEIVNTTNKQEFISKDYLRKVFEEQHKAHTKIITDARENKNLEDLRAIYHSCCGEISFAQALGIIDISEYFELTKLYADLAFKTTDHPEI